MIVIITISVYIYIYIFILFTPSYGNVYEANDDCQRTIKCSLNFHGNLMEYEWLIYEDTS